MDLVGMSRILGVLCLVLYGWILADLQVPVASGSDQAGYRLQADLWQNGRFSIPNRIPEAVDDLPKRLFQTLGTHYSEHREGLVATYPAGLPIQMALVYHLFGKETGLFLLGGLYPALAVWLMYVISRRLGLDEVWSVVLSISLAVSPLFLFSAVSLMTDLPSTTLCLLVFYAGLRAKDHWAWAMAAGFFLAAAVWMRPTNFVMAAPLFVLIPQWKRLIVVGLTGFPFAVALAVYQNYLYGSPLTSGYGAVDSLFRREYFKLSWDHYVTWLPRLVPLSVAALPMSLVLPWRNAWRESLALLLWAIGFLGLYAFYYHTHETWWFLRFILPGFPALLFVAALGFRFLARLVGRTYGPTLLTAAGVVAMPLIAVSAFHVAAEKNVPWFIQGELGYPITAQWAMEALPRESAIFAMQTSATLLYYTDFTVLRWDHLPPDQIEEVAQRLTAAGHPVYAILMGFELVDPRTTPITSRWAVIHTIGMFRVFRYPEERVDRAVGD